MLRASVVMSRISYDRTRATVRIDPHHRRKLQASQKPVKNDKNE